MTDLIERLEKATAPDRDLDAQIAVAVFKTISTDDDLIYAHMRDPGHDASHPGHYFVKSRSGAEGRTAPLYTSSIDAALTLVPEGFYWVLGYGRTFETEPLGAAGLKRPNAPDDEWVAQAEGATVPIALCIAALKARAGGA